MTDEKDKSLQDLHTRDLTVALTSEVCYPDQGPECTCDNDDEHWWINCMFHLVGGYGAHEVGYGCFRCGAHHFYQADWANAKEGCYAPPPAADAVDPSVDNTGTPSTRV